MILKEVQVRKLNAIHLFLSNLSQQKCASDGQGIPRIIGGIDLVVFRSRDGDGDDWISEVQAVSLMTLRRFTLANFTAILLAIFSLPGICD